MKQPNHKSSSTSIEKGSSKGPAPEISVIQLLHEDHERVAALFDQYQIAMSEDPKQREGIAEQVFLELEIHTQLEEELFYPAMKQKADEETKELIAASVHEHNTVKKIIDELRSTQLDDEEYDNLFMELIDNVEHHVEEEETEMFSLAMEQPAGKLEQLAAKMEQRKQQLTAKQ